MNIKKSAQLERIYRLAERIKIEYASTDISQVHFIAAFIEQYLVMSEASSVTEEMRDSFVNFGCSENFLKSVLVAAEKWISENQYIKYVDANALEDCFSEAIEMSRYAGKKEILTKEIITSIINNISPGLKDVFNNANNIQFRDEIEKSNSNEKARVIPNKKREPKTEHNSFYSPAKIVFRVKRMQKTLREKVHGQDEAISAVVASYFNTLLRGTAAGKKGGPSATFLFAGAPGVGKTYLASVFAEALDIPFCRFDMSSFSDKESALEFAGSDNVYKNSHEGLVTGFVNKNPRCVLLFDEIEKAHINIIHLFLQILDAGWLKDSYLGENVSFKDTIIIMTTNAGKNLYENLEPGMATPNRKTVINAITNDVNPVTGLCFFPEAICSRFAAGNVVLFNPLGAQELLKIGNSVIKSSIENYEKKLGLSIEVDENLCAALLFAEGGKVDARSISGRAKNFIANEVYNWFRFASEKKEVSLNEIKKLEIKIGTEKDSKKLFKPSEKQNILLFSENADTYKHLKSNRNYKLFNVSTIKQAYEIINDKDIAFSVCDIFGTESPTLNIEDTESEGRKFLDILVKERVPAFVYCSEKHKINSEERQALTECGVRGFVEQTDKATKLKSICEGVYIEKTLHDLGRSKKALAFDCVYEIEDDTAIIELSDLRIISIVDVSDKDDIADVCMTDISFDDVIGAEDAKAELKGFISYLKEPKLYIKNKIPTPKGVVLYGPPGTGKTMLAKALSHESGATFIATQGNDFLSPKVGGGAQEVKRIFALARKYAPTVLFIDEFDIIAKNRFTNSIAEEVVNALLNEMDGFSTNSSRPVFVLATTNFEAGFGNESALDAALLRRFDRRIFVDLPNAEERKYFIEKRLAESRQKLKKDVIKSVVARSIGMSLAELGSIIDFSLRGMLQAGFTTLSGEFFDEAFETYRFGERNYWSEDLLRRVAVHESGHAFVSYQNGNKPSYITISARGSFGGYVQLPDNDMHLYTKNQLLEKIRVLLAGRASELVFYGDDDGVSTGAEADIKSATRIALQMITVYGMSDEFGITTKESPDSEAMKLCDKILLDELKKAEEIISQNKKKIEKIVKILLEKNHLMGDKIEEMFKTI